MMRQVVTDDAVLIFFLILVIASYQKGHWPNITDIVRHKVKLAYTVIFTPDYEPTDTVQTCVSIISISTSCPKK